MTVFKDLPNGSTFTFESEKLYPYGGLVKGPWIKVSARQYCHVDDPQQIHRVGAINVRVVLARV